MKEALKRTRIAWAGSLLLHAGAASLIFWEFKEARPAAVEISSIEVIASSSDSVKPDPRKAPPLSERRRSQARAAPEPMAPAAPTTSAVPAANPSAIRSYLALVRDKLSREIRVPRTRGASSLRVTLEITLTKDGEVKSSEIRESSGFADFDQSVIEALQRARPFPPFSAGMSRVQEVTLRLPVEIRVRD